MNDVFPFRRRLEERQGILPGHGIKNEDFSLPTGSLFFFKSPATSSNLLDEHGEYSFVFYFIHAERQRVNDSDNFPGVLYACDVDLSEVG